MPRPTPEDVLKPKALSFRGTSLTRDWRLAGQVSQTRLPRGTLRVGEMAMGGRRVRRVHTERCGQAAPGVLGPTVPVHPEPLATFLAPYPPAVRDLFLAARALLLRHLKPAVELHIDATSAVCGSFGYTESMREAFVNLAAYADHVTLVFPWGIHLKAPKKRLNGAGNQVRHMRVEGLETLRDPYVLGLVDQAAARAPRPDGKSVRPAILVKVYEGPKRRPKATKPVPVKRARTVTTR
jgi:hypothetical protein